MTARPLAPLLAAALAACGAQGGPDNEAETDAARERPIPCSVQAHGIGEVERNLRAQPERPPCDDSVDAQRIALDELIRIIPDQHPAFYYVLASRLFEANRRDDAVSWFYAGQLRYRIRLACHPDLAPDTEPALFASLQNDVGQVVNEHAGGNPAQWAAAMERALDWDARTRNGFEPKAPCQASIAEQREGLRELVRHVRDNADQIRRERAARGLGNR
jgi:hypothetical protein